MPTRTKHTVIFSTPPAPLPDLRGWPSSRRKTRGFTLIDSLGRHRDHCDFGLVAVAGGPTGTRGGPQRQCKNNIKQLLLALHNYADTYSSTIVPYSIDNHGQIQYTLGTGSSPGQTRYWFGNVDFSQTNPALQLDFMQGFLAPYMETNRAAYQCPDFGPDQVDLVRFGQMASGYGYNAYYIGPGIGYDYSNWPTVAVSSTPVCYKFAAVSQMTQTIAFAEHRRLQLVELLSQRVLHRKLVYRATEPNPADRTLPAPRHGQRGILGWARRNRGPELDQFTVLFLGGGYPKQLRPPTGIHRQQRLLLSASEDDGDAMNSNGVRQISKCGRRKRRFPWHG